MTPDPTRHTTTPPNMHTSTPEQQHTHAHAPLPTFSLPMPTPIHAHTHTCTPHALPAHSYTPQAPWARLAPLAPLGPLGLLGPHSPRTECTVAPEVVHPCHDGPRTSALHPPAPSARTRPEPSCDPQTARTAEELALTLPPPVVAAPTDCPSQTHNTTQHRTTHAHAHTHTHHHQR